ncbi:MAG: hypothetical protein PHV78_02630 [Patescibacteria group bacterium]|nr:hypothetical protein [Patescibacteria group bacterium]MDD5121714.1 hypothetical protein [Patescibacteria group bacterium]MDD5221709.1 hypothetical protein [Patescibacteria group bacterium]MDD5396122.1 hypothetical protein [Patescibacteria group bacterium]
MIQFITPKLFQSIVDQGYDMAALWMNEVVKMILKLYWPYILAFLFFAALVKICQWRIGSLIYHIIAGTFLMVLFIIGGGFKIFFNPFFDLICFFIYKLSFYLTGQTWHSRLR